MMKQIGKNATTWKTINSIITRSYMYLDFLLIKPFLQTVISLKMYTHQLYFCDYILLAS